MGKSNEMTGLTPLQTKKLVLGTLLSGDTRDNLYIEGHHGSGKTDLLLQAAIEVWGTPAQRQMPVDELLRMTDEDRGWAFRREYPATKTVEDYMGNPGLREVNGVLKTLYGVPQFVPTNLKLPGLLVIEELAHAQEDVQKMCFPFLQDRKVGEFILPPGLFIVVTGNPPNSIHNVPEFPPALKDRMCRVGYVHSAKEWVNWARGGEVTDTVTKLRAAAAKYKMSEARAHDAVISFIEDNPDMMHVIHDDGEPGPTPRGWCSVSRWLDRLEAGLIEEYMFLEILRNRVGTKEAARFIGHFKNYSKRAVTAEELMGDYAKFLPRYKEQSPAGKAETVQLVMVWLNKAVGEMTPGCDTLKNLSDLLVNQVDRGILMAKSMSGEVEEAMNKLVQLGPDGIAVGKKLASIRFKAEQDRNSKGK